jgi:hypothetical protein
MAEWTLLLEPKKDDHAIAFCGSIPNRKADIEWRVGGPVKAALGKIA